MQAACCSQALGRIVTSRLNGSAFTLGQSGYSTFRYKTKGGKPPSLPPAKTKRYQVVEQPWMEPAEVRELLWRRQAYNTALNSIRTMFKQELAESGGRLGIDEDIQELKQKDAAEFDRRLALNLEENLRLAGLRAAREKEDRATLERETAAAVAEALAKEAEFHAEREAELERLRRLSVEVVRPETLEERILEALETPVDRNVVLDRLGVEYVSAAAPVKYIAAPLPDDATWLYQNKPEPLVIKDEDQRREKLQAAGISVAEDDSKKVTNVAAQLD